MITRETMKPRNKLRFWYLLNWKPRFYWHVSWDRGRRGGQSDSIEMFTPRLWSLLRVLQSPPQVCRLPHRHLSLLLLRCLDENMQLCSTVFRQMLSCCMDERSLRIHFSESRTRGSDNNHKLLITRLLSDRNSGPGPTFVAVQSNITEQTCFFQAHIPGF